MATIVGTNAGERLIGTPNDDTLLALGGDDILDGGAGSNSIDGGSGFDTVDYSAVPARIFVSLLLGRGTGGGFDTLVSVENAIGSAFDDDMYGDNGANVLDGRAGNDTLYGFSGDDIFRGGAGNNTIDGGNGSDTISYALAHTAAVVSLSWQSATGDGVDHLTSIENAAGSDFNDVIYGSNDANKLSGEAGDDFVFGFNGNDILSGGAGFNHLDGGVGIDAVSYDSATRGATVSLIWHTGSADGIDSLADIENVIGSAFNDVLYGDNNDNTFDGGRGDNTYYGFGGIDTVTYAALTSAVTVSLPWQTATGSGFDTLYDIENLIGTAFNDTLYGANIVANAFDAGDGADAIFGFGGSDRLIGGFGNDEIDGGTGSDILYGDVQTLSGTGGNDLIRGFSPGAAGNTEADNNTIFGDAEFVKDIFDVRPFGGADTIYGGNGSDTIYGDARSVIEESGFVRSVTGGSDWIDGGGGNDLIYGDFATAGVVAKGVFGAADTIFGGDGNDEIWGDGPGARGANDVIAGGAGDDVIYGDGIPGGGFGIHFPPAHFVVFAGKGNDIIDGGDGDDTIYGDSPSTGVLGGGGDDSITGGRGNDTLYGDGQITDDSSGAGHDNFIFAQMSGVDVIKDFRTFGVADEIDLQAYHFAGFGSLAIADDVNGNAVISLTTTDTITLQGVHAASLSAVDFIL
jgi:Ca2+-binding RTX toxin-like protein